MANYDVDGLTFSFPEDWKVARYDTWGFYRNRFQSITENVKAVDLLAISPDNTLYIVEVKDYRKFPRVKSDDIDAEVRRKVFCTIAALLPAKIHALDPSEKTFAAAAIKAARLKVILHLEQPNRQSTLFPRPINPSNIELKLRQALKAIDPKPKVWDRHTPDSPWSVN